MVAYTRICEVADTFAADGQTPGVRAVQRITGGSFRDVSKHLATWRSLHPQYTTSPPPTDWINKAEHNRLMAEAEDRLEAERRHLMLQTDQIRQGIAAPHAGQIARLQRRISELENQVALLEAKLGANDRRALDSK